MKNTKVCSKCQQEKSLDSFAKNKNNRKDGLSYQCKACVSAKYQENWDMRQVARKKYAIENREYLLQKKREYCAAHREHKRLYDLEYRVENREAIRKLKRDWERAHKDDPINKIKKNMRRRLHHVLNGNLKAQKTFDLVGCDAAALKVHLERQFVEGMTWKNYGLGDKKWHIDHIRPCASFDLSNPDEQRVCFHHSNLQPLWAADNIAKSDNILNKKERQELLPAALATNGQ